MVRGASTFRIVKFLEDDTRYIAADAGTRARPPDTGFGRCASKISSTSTDRLRTSLSASRGSDVFRDSRISRLPMVSRRSAAPSHGGSKLNRASGAADVWAWLPPFRCTRSVYRREQKPYKIQDIACPPTPWHGLAERESAEWSLKRMYYQAISIEIVDSSPIHSPADAVLCRYAMIQGDMGYPPCACQFGRYITRVRRYSRTRFGAMAPRLAPYRSRVHTGVGTRAQQILLRHPTPQPRKNPTKRRGIDAPRLHVTEPEPLLFAEIID